MLFIRLRRNDKIPNNAGYCLCRVWWYGKVCRLWTEKSQDANNVSLAYKAKVISLQAVFGIVSLSYRNNPLFALWTRPYKGTDTSGPVWQNLSPDCNMNFLRSLNRTTIVRSAYSSSQECLSITIRCVFFPIISCVIARHSIWQYVIMQRVMYAITIYRMMIEFVQYSWHGSAWRPKIGHHVIRIVHRQRILSIQQLKLIWLYILYSDTYSC